MKEHLTLTHWKLKKQQLRVYTMEHIANIIFFFTNSDYLYIFLDIEGCLVDIMEDNLKKYRNTAESVSTLNNVYAKIIPREYTIFDNY